MKEVTYEDWQKNPTPRMMWVWNDDVENKEKIKVAYVLNNGRTYCSYYSYEEKCENEEVPNNILIREDDGEWREPLVEVE